MDSNPRKSLVRQLAAASLVAVLTMGVLLAVSGASASRRGDFTFASAHSGDRWAYSLELGAGWDFGVNDTVHPGGPQDGFVLAWSLENVRLADGLLHRAARLDVEGVLYDPSPFDHDRDGRSWNDYKRTQWVGEEGPLAVVVGGGWGSASGSVELAPLGIPVMGTRQGVDMASLVTDFHPDSGLCLGDLRRAGQSVSLDGPLFLTRTCHFARLFELTASTVFRAGDVETVNGLSALRFDSPTVSLWYNPAIPYPVQVQNFADDGRTFVLRMTGFAAGGQPLPVPDDLMDRQPSPKLDVQPAQPWGPDDAGVDLEFPLSEAFLRARDDPEYQDLRAYLARHPDAIATSGYLTIEQQVRETGPTSQRTGEARSWSVVLAEGTDCFGFSATKQTSFPPPSPLSLLVPPDEPTYEFDSWSGTGATTCDQGLDLPATKRPNWPTVASALAVWATYANASEIQQGPNGWGFRLTYDDGWHALLSVGQAAGQALVTTSLTSMHGTGSGGPGGSLDLDDGKVTSYTRVTTEFRREQTLAGLPAPSTATANDRAAGLITAPTGLGGLSPVEVTGFSLLAALVGAMVFLWPKLTPLALFSRVPGPQLLQHPVRAELVQRIEAQPGIHYQDLVRAMGKGRGAVEHHLRKLQTSGLVKAIAASGYTCYFPAAFDHRVAMGLPLLKSDGARAILAAVQAQPGASASHIVAATGLSQAAVNHHLQRLGAAGLVQVSRNGRSLAIQPTALGGQVAAAS